MYAPCARNSFANVCSTKFNLEVTFFALSFGTVCPQFVHCTVPEDPFPPFVRPLLARFKWHKIQPFCLLIFLRVIWNKCTKFMPKFMEKITLSFNPMSDLNTSMINFGRIMSLLF